MEPSSQVPTESQPVALGRRRPWVLYAALVAAVIAGFASGFALRQYASQAAGSNNARIEELRHDLTKQAASAGAQIQVLQKDVADRDSQIAGLQDAATKVTDLQTQVTVLSKQLGDLEKNGGVQKLSQLADGLANDRLLLTELRKDPPSTPADARVYWSGIKTIAVKSSPTLGPLADKVISAITPYFSWTSRDYSTVLQQQSAYITTGANLYDVSSKTFWNAALKVTIDRMQAVAQTVP